MAPLHNVMQTNCLVLATSTLPLECQRNNTSTHLESAFTLTVEQPQACSISRRSMAAPHLESAFTLTVE